MMSTNGSKANGTDPPGLINQWGWSVDEEENCEDKTLEEKFMEVDESEWKMAGKKLPRTRRK
eukprot:3105492-Ditylum_brightwellii.AAC.1